mmetsp:Transcript_65188/g.72806  ORF Transcript_65188/g.72806 Transcript_65188/m.72806 type:complete len:80 (-) Transcript_65188:67-306(-)
MIGEGFAIAYAFTPSLLLLLLLVRQQCDRDCFRNNDNNFNDTDTSTYNELRPQQRRFFFDTVTDTSTYYDGRTNDVCCC